MCLPRDGKVKSRFVFFLKTVMLVRFLGTFSFYKTTHYRKGFSFYDLHELHGRNCLFLGSQEFSHHANKLWQILPFLSMKKSPEETHKSQDSCSLLFSAKTQRSVASKAPRGHTNLKISLTSMAVKYKK